MDVMCCEKLVGCENQDPNRAAEARRPVKQFSASALSPSKRRKQLLAEAGGDVAVHTPARTSSHSASPSRDQGLGSPEGVLPAGVAGNTLHEVFARLGKRDVFERAAATCKAWRDVAHSEALWSLHPHSLVDRLVITDKLVERRSKGKLFRCRWLGGRGDSTLLRIVNLEVTNAGKDDGVPTSFLREAVMLKSLRHPNIVKLFGAEIRGVHAYICTEFIQDNFVVWHRRLDVCTRVERLGEIRGKFGQLLTGVAHLHDHGVMHRNLKPDNLFLDGAGTVKIGDFTTTRMLDIPIQAYTPEVPKERECSGREMRRLWYRAPELLLRDEVYTPRVDVWSVGCLLAEAATGRQLFQSDSEIDHLFRIFRLLGTPTAETWPEAVGMKGFSPKFPMFSGFPLVQVARAASCGSTADQDRLTVQAQPERGEILQQVVSVASVLGLDGMRALDGMLRLRPEDRAGARETLELPFFGTGACAGGWLQGERPTLDPLTEGWLRGKKPPAADLIIKADAPEPLTPPNAHDALKDVLCPPMNVDKSAMSPRMAWSITTAMRQRERAEGSLAGEPGLPSNFDAAKRAEMIDSIVRLATSLALSDCSLHLAAGLVDRYLAQDDCDIDASRSQLVAAACLKIADSFAEQSNEYYKQESAIEYSAAARSEITVEQILQCEKDMLTKFDFDIRLPNAHWFTGCILAYGRFASGGSVAKTAFFVGDLVLLDYDLLRYSPSLRAQCSLVVAAFLAAPIRQSKATANDGVRRLKFWDTQVRGHFCRDNTSIDATMCLQSTVRVLIEKRREWRSTGLTAVETKHQKVCLTLAYPETFPIAELVKYILPDSQR